MLNGQVLESVESEHDLGVRIRKYLKVSNQCAKAYAKASKILGMINRVVVNKSKEIMLRLYMSLVRPYVEFYIAVSLLHYKKDKACIEKIQKKVYKNDSACEQVLLKKD